MNNQANSETPTTKDSKLEIFHEMALIGCAGGLGGILLYFAAWLNKSIESFLFSEFFVTIFLGFGAAIIGIYFVARTDMRHFRYAFSLAIVCGLSWELVYETASQAFANQAKQIELNEMRDNIEKTGEIISKIKIDSEDKLDAHINEAIKNISILSDKAAKIDDASIKYDIASNADILVNNIKWIKEKNPDIPLDVDEKKNKLAATFYTANNPYVASYDWAKQKPSVNFTQPWWRTNTGWDTVWAPEVNQQKTQ